MNPKDKMEVAANIVIALISSEKTTISEDSVIQTLEKTYKKIDELTKDNSKPINIPTITG